MKRMLLPNGMDLEYEYCDGYYWDINNEYLYFELGKFGFCTRTIDFSTDYFKYN